MSKVKVLSVSEWLSQWQGHLLSCCGQLKMMSWEPWASGCFDNVTGLHLEKVFRQLWCSTVRSNKAAFRNLFGSHHPENPERSNLSLDPKCVLSSFLLVLHTCSCVFEYNMTHWAFSHWIPLFGKDPFQLGDDSIVVKAGGCQVTQVLSVNNKSTAYLPYGGWGKTLWDCCRKCLNFNCHCRSQSFEGLIAG